MTTPRKLYQRIAELFTAMQNCQKSGNTEWFDRHRDLLCELVKEHLPSGGGFDAGTSFDFDRSKPNLLIFNTSFHHMHDSGMYDGWTEHSVRVTPDLASGFDMRITGRDRRDIKDYIGETFSTALATPVER